MTERGWLTMEEGGEEETHSVMECLLEWLQGDT